MPIHITGVKKGPGGHTSYEFQVIKQEGASEMVRCKGECGSVFIFGVVPDYKDGYCKDCYITKLEKELEEIKKTWVKPVPIY